VICPPAPPGAIQKNLLGICKDYPYSKNCLDWKNKVSCMTCEDKDSKIPGRETPAERKNDGKFGVDKDGKPIFSKGDKVECGVDGCTFPKIGKKTLMVNTLDSKDNKDYKAGDEVVDCRLALPALFSGVDGSDPISDDNAFNGICKDAGDGISICEARLPLSICMTDCYYGYEVEWTTSWGKFTKLTAADLKKYDGDDIKMTDICPDNEKNKKDNIGRVAMKRDGPWGKLLNEIGPDCETKIGSSMYTKCKTLNGEELPEDEQFLAKDLGEECPERLEVNKKNAYWYTILGGEKYGKGQTNCFCKKVSIDLEVFPEVAMLFELKSITEMACIDKNSFGCFLEIFSVLQDRKASQDDLSSAFASLREWIQAA